MKKKPELEKIKMANQKGYKLKIFNDGMRMMIDKNIVKLLQWRRNAIEECLNNFKLGYKKKIEYEYRLLELDYLISRREDFK